MLHDDDGDSYFNVFTVKMLQSFLNKMSDEYHNNKFP